MSDREPLGSGRCEDAQVLAMTVLFGEAQANDEVALEAHLRQCEACRTAHRENGAVLALLSADLEVSPPAVSSREATQAGMRRGSWVRVAAAGLLAAGLVVGSGLRVDWVGGRGVVGHRWSDPTGLRTDDDLRLSLADAERRITAAFQKAWAQREEELRSAMGSEIATLRGEIERRTEALSVGTQRELQELEDRLVFLVDRLAGLALGESERLQTVVGILAARR